MSQTSGIGSSRGDRPPAEFAFSTPSSASPFAAVVQETVLNPEGRRPPDRDASSFELIPSEGAPAPDSRVWKRLFPGEAEAAGGVDFEAPAGCELGHFAIEERIGSGGMGAVFRALDNRLQRVVALKVLSPAQTRDRASVLRFLNEARAAARLDHENIARVYYVGEDRGLHFIAFEYVTGQNVRDLIARTGRLPVADAVNYALQVAAALRHTAAAGVVHRDIKPSNIIITPAGRAKLVDLGLARKLSSDTVGDLTIAGTTLGTFDYISPEQARDPRNVDVRSDIYSLGCTLYHMLTGGPPYSSGTVLQKLLDHQSGQAPDARSLNPQVPQALAAVCRKMMAGDPRNRYSTPDELIRDLAAVAATLGLRPLPSEGFVWTRPAAAAKSRVPSGLIWAGVAAIVLLLAFAWPGGDDRTPRADTGREAAVPPTQPENGATPAVTDRGREPFASKTAVAAADLGLPKNKPSSLIRPSVGGLNKLPRKETGRVAAADMGGTSEAVGQPAPVVASQQSESPPEAGDLADLGRQARNVGELFWPYLGDLFTPEPPTVPASNNVATRTTTAPPVFTAPYVLQSTSGEPNRFRTLAEAAAKAYNNDVIELHYDGKPPEGVTQPFVVERKQITIKAGVDETGRTFRPIVEFAVDAASNPSAKARMISVAGNAGGLKMEGVEIRMSVLGPARNAAGQWALFALSDTEQVRLTDVAITLVNPEASPLTVFDLRPPDNVSAESYEIMGMMKDDDAKGFGVEMQRCFVRGPGDLVTIAHTLPGRVAIRDSAFALGSALFNVTGGVEQPLAGDLVQVDLDHVTAVVGQGVLRLHLERGDEATPLRFKADNNLFATTTAGPLVQMDGAKSAADFEKALAWVPKGNVYDGFTMFWSIQTDDDLVDMGKTGWSEWTSHWSRGVADPATAERAISPDDGLTRIWKNPEEVRGVQWDGITADDLALDADDAPIDLLSATDSGLVGAPVEKLPETTPAPVSIGAAPRGATSR
jgi:serine/threonine-protein kinase